MKFKNKITGSIINTENEFVIKQMQKSQTFAEIKENSYVKKEVKEVEPEMEQSKEDKKKIK